MRKMAVLIILLGTVLIPLESLAQCGLTWRGTGGWGVGAQYDRMFDPSKMTTISGKVLRIDKMTPTSDMQQGVYLLMETAKGNRIVHLGPVWYVENQDVTLMPNDRIEVTGSQIMVNNRPIMIASDVTKGDETLVLRDDAGRPAWVAWKRKKTS